MYSRTYGGVYQDVPPPPLSGVLLQGGEVLNVHLMLLHLDVASLLQLGERPHYSLPVGTDHRCSVDARACQQYRNSRDRTRWYPTVLNGRKSAYLCEFSAYL
jgi:hypothetical protein